MTARANQIAVLLMVLMVVACFGLSAWLEPRHEARQKGQSADILTLLMGDSRRIFANHFFVKADSYFHSGYYPTIFDNQESFQTAHMAADAGALKSKNQGDEEFFMGKPRDFVEAFERHFIPSRHTHLDEGGAEGLKPGSDLGEGQAGEVREILPWLKLSAELDPNRIETYVVTAYWLRSRMGRVKEAEDFLRDGLRANPGNPALLFELGRICLEDKKDPARARNIWEAGVARLDAQKTPRTEQDDFMLFQLTLELARMEEAQGNLPAALAWLKRVKTVSPEPEQIQKQINELQQKLAGLPATATNTPPAQPPK